MILLDTCTLLWLSYDPSLIPDKALEHIESSNKRYLSAISALEISLKIRDRKMKLPLPFPEWLSEIQKHLKLETIEISPIIAYLSGQLPLIHRDPFDRLIIATAMTNKLTLITPDKHIQKYSVDTTWNE